MIQESNVDTRERAHLYLKEVELGEKILIQEAGKDQEMVELHRRGRRQIRVKRPGSSETELVNLTDVVVPEEFHPGS